MIIGSEVFTPWPISGERAPMKVVPSFSMRTNRPIEGAVSGVAGEVAAREERGTKWSASSMPPAAVAPRCRNVRRSRVGAESGRLMRRMLAGSGRNSTRGTLRLSQSWLGGHVGGLLRRQGGSEVALCSCACLILCLAVGFRVG